MPDSIPDARQRFTSRVDAYVVARPRYPREVLDHLRREIALTSNWTVADIGSGTGISCEPFLENGNTVYGVEPNAAMRSAAEQSLRAFATFHSVPGDAEATTLEAESIDLVIAAQAFHWFDHAAARNEFVRILRPGGWALLMWNDRRLSGTPFLEAYEQLLLTYGTDYLKIRHNNIADADIARFFAPAQVRRATFDHAQHLDFDALRSRLLSSSYVPAAGDPRHRPMLAELRRIFDQHNDNGRVSILYQTQLFYGQLHKRSAISNSS